MTLSKTQARFPNGFRISEGRIQEKRPDHPLAGWDGWVWQHRIVLYAEIGPGTHPCHWCGYLLDWHAENPDDQLYVDHVDFNKLNNDPDNLVASCKPCNSSRGDRPREGWIPPRHAERLKAGGSRLPRLAPREVPKRIQLSRKKGYRKPPDAVVVSRPTKWGNPWSMQEGLSRVECVARFETYLFARRNPRPGWKDFIGYPTDTEIIRELRGKDLACWCPLPAEDEPDQCHAAVLISLANGDADA